MKHKSHIESFLEHIEKLNISGVINRLSNWNKDRIRKKDRLEIYNKYKSGDISYEEYVKQRKEIEERYKEEDK